MQNPGYIALSRQVVLARQLDVTANNIANLDTVGFKRQGVLFREHVSDVARGEQASYVADVGTVRDTSQGTLRRTDRPLDIGIEGGGYLSLETPAGERYGRDGQFQLNGDSEIVNRNGFPLLDTDGERITVPPDAAEIVIQTDGAILAGDDEIARIKVSRFENPQELIHTADGVYRADGQPPLEDQASKLRQGMLESSNVNPIRELVNMLEIQRDYEGAHKMVKGEHDRLTRAIRELARIEQS